jgi:dsRNA-specific ribonuclease
MPVAIPKLPSPLPRLPDVAEELKKQSFTHTSSTCTNTPVAYRRLALLGDASLHAVITRILFEHPVEFDVGTINEIRTTYVAKANLARWGRAYRLDEKVNVGAHMLPLKEEDRDKLASMTFQAYLGALSLTSNDTLTQFIKALITPSLKRWKPQGVPDKRAKQTLNERLVGLRIAVARYTYTDRGGDAETGARFEVKCIVRGHIVGRGVGRNSQEGSWVAAGAANNLDDEFFIGLEDKE